jgi:hypothetical protein
VCAAPGHNEVREERVLVAPSKIQVVSERVLVKPAHNERRAVPATVEADTRIGPIKIKSSVGETVYEDVEVPAEYAVVEKRVEVPAKYELVRHEVHVPARFDTVTKQVEVPAVYSDVTREVTIPGHFEDRAVVAPPTTVVIEPRPRPAVDIDLNFWSRHHHND